MPRPQSWLLSARPIPISRRRIILTSRPKLSAYFLGAATFAAIYLFANPEWIGLPPRRSHEVPTRAPRPKKGLSEDKRNLFIPVVWLWKRQGESYGRASPEMAAFLALHKDEGRRRELKERILKEIVTSPIAIRSILRITGGSIHNHESWVAFHYPKTAPAQYVRYGIAVTDRGLRWAHSVVDHEHGYAVSTLLFPSALMSALWAVGVQVFAAPFAWLSLGSGKGGQKMAPPLESLPDVNSHQDESRTQKLPANDNVLDSGFKQLMTKLEQDSAISAALNTFKSTYASRREGGLISNTRGVCILEGDVHWQGPRGSCHVIIMAEYLPSTDSFLSLTVSNAAFYPTGSRV